METAEELRDKLKAWFSTGTDRRNGEKKLAAFCEKEGIVRMTYYRKMDANPEALDYEFLIRAVEFMQEYKAKRQYQQRMNEARFIETASLALA